MNDETSGQLTDKWPIPAYTRDNLWVEGITGAVQVEGPYGLFNLHAPCPELTVYWGTVESGSALVTLPWQPDNLAWDGSVRIAGYIDSIHATPQVPGAGLVYILVVGGQPLRTAIPPYPGPAQRHQPLVKPDFYTGLNTDVAETTTTWLLPANNPLAEIVHRALADNQRIHCFGRLAADEDATWQSVCAMPILLEAITLFSS